jgi:hypothetical protein
MDGFEKVFMRPAAGRAWSQSDFMSTRGSFSSISTRSQQQQHPQQPVLLLRPLPRPAGGAQGPNHGAAQQAQPQPGAAPHHPQCRHHHAQSG